MGRWVCVTMALVAAGLHAQPLALPVPQPITVAEPFAPPQQGQPFVAPTGVPADLLAASEALFALGLPDPRGCVYRQVDIGHDCEGWVLPGGDGPRWMIDWQGQPHAARSAGMPADLAAACAAAADNDARKLWWRWLHRDRPASISHAQLSPLAACLLLRAGATEQAVAMWQASAADPHRQPGDWELPNDRFLAAATIWIGCVYCRGQADHLAGWHGQALAHFEQAQALVAKAVAAADHLGIAAGPSWAPPANRSHLPYFAELPALINEQKRRLAQPARPRPLDVGPDAYPTRAAYIAALVDDLDQVRTSQPGFTKTPYYANDPTLAALVAEGAPAIRPLADAVANDPRYTLCLTGNDMDYTASGPARVSTVALAALERIAGQPLISRPVGGAWQVDIVGVTREFAERYGGVSSEQRWYSQLADDAARPTWRAAADNLVRREPSGRLAGEALRGKTKPELGDLLTSRLREVVDKCAPDDWSAVDLADSLARAMVAWDGAKRLPDLAWLQHHPRWGAAGDAVPTGRPAFWAFLQRCLLGDAEARRTYARWLTSERSVRYTAAVLEPLLKVTGEPAFAGLARRAFLAPDSPLNPLSGEPPGLLLSGQQLPWAALLKLPEFRQAMLLALADRRQIGQWVVALRGERVDLGDEPWYGWRAGPVGALTREPATWQAVRVCDAYANQLATVCGLPECWPGAPQEERDATVAATADAIARYGQRIGPSPDPRWTAAILLPRLDRLATADDVAAGRAVFSLPRDKAVRRVELPSYPTRCRWPRDASDTGEGLLWQAEERLEGGRWRRYLGYVGSRGIARVPAEEIELVDPTGQRWTPAGDGWEARLVAPEPSAPTVVTLWLRNSRAVPAAIDEVWLRPTADGASALRQGVRLRLWCWPETTPGQMATLEVKDPVGFPDEGRLRYLEPGESFIAGRLDLRRFCQPTPAGTYDLALLLRPRDGAAPPVYASTRFALDQEH